ncbi:unnamed protein product, partial [Didymodactylos carnosus]
QKGANDMITSTDLIENINKIDLSLLTRLINAINQHRQNDDLSTDICSEQTSLIKTTTPDVLEKTSFAYKKLINEGYIIIDRLGAIGISVYIVHCWLKEGIRLVKRLSYRTADEDIRKK